MAYELIEELIKHKFDMFTEFWTGVKISRHTSLRISNSEQKQNEKREVVFHMLAHLVQEGELMIVDLEKMHSIWLFRLLVLILLERRE
jgi:hypothetical protein